MNENLSNQGGKMRLKILLSILGIVIIGGVIVLYVWGPLGEAKPAWKCGYDIQLTANPGQVDADGISQSDVVATVSQGKGKNRSLVPGETVSFSSTLGDLSETQAITDTNGQAKVRISSSRAGVAASIKSQLGSCAKYVEVQFVSSRPPAQELFSDNFSGDLSKWVIAWDGYGTVKIENGALMMAPKASTSPSETHSALVRAGSQSWGDYTYNLKMNTVEQLRIGSAPNHWEVGWITFRHQDNSRFYYFIFKPNGIELGKALGNDQQAFFVTESSPRLQLNKWNNYKIVLQGANIKVYIDGTLVANYTDTNNPFLTGGIGLYNEDAKVYYDDVKVTE